MADTTVQVAAEVLGNNAYVKSVFRIPMLAADNPQRSLDYWRAGAYEHANGWGFAERWVPRSRERNTPNGEWVPTWINLNHYTLLRLTDKATG